MKIYTKTGDQGETSLFGGKRVQKNCLEIDAIGEVDETNATIGVLVATLSNDLKGVHDHLEVVQHRLFTVGANLAAVQMEIGKVPQLGDDDVASLERWIDQMEAELAPLTQFILPGGSVASAQAFLARAVCRRAERRVVELTQTYPALPPLISQYLNRLSDVLFMLGRWLNGKAGQADVMWKK